MWADETADLIADLLPSVAALFLQAALLNTPFLRRGLRRMRKDAVHVAVGVMHGMQWSGTAAAALSRAAGGYAATSVRFVSTPRPPRRPALGAVRPRHLLTTPPPPPPGYSTAPPPAGWPTAPPAMARPTAAPTAVPQGLHRSALPRPPPPRCCPQAAAQCGVPRPPPRRQPPQGPVPGGMSTPKAAGKPPVDPADRIVPGTPWVSQETIAQHSEHRMGGVQPLQLQ
eukprot:TRINITY_DN17880_c0_g1_i2.p1 TRINITY_DN17880_c0_g1~~TRINITY_DN17880_c0_g1_i2.p1  ORF type:complete len:258 (+),score=53.41 TRINITY_DN17880_c0_g1_i2:96-776(+)